MNLILDTNMIYYIAGVSESYLDKKKLIEEIALYENKYVSELSMLEIYSHFRNNIEKLKSIINTLSMLKYPVWPYFDKEHSIVNEKFNELLKDDKFIKFLADDSLRIRIDMESKFLNFWACSIASVYLAINYNENPVNTENIKVLNKNLFNTIILLNNNDNAYLSEMRDVLYKFYNDYDESKFKDKVVNYILDICEIYTNILHVSYEGIDFLDFLNNQHNYQEDVKEKIFIKISDDIFFKKIEKRKLQKKELVNKIFIEKLDDNLKYYGDKLNNFMNPSVVKYYIILFKKFFTLDNKKIEKNNVIDSLLLSHYPENLVLTADEDFIKIMSEINPDCSNQILNILKKCKK